MLIVLRAVATQLKKAQRNNWSIAMDNEMLTTGDVSREYKLTESSLEKWRVAGIGPDYHKLSRKVMYRRSDVERWLDENRRRSTSDAARKCEREE